MHGSHKTDHTPRPPEPYTPTPDGFERRLRAWVGLPADGVPTPDAEDAQAPSKENCTRDHTGGG
jgi:hypothetical protein